MVNQAIGASCFCFVSKCDVGCMPRETFCLSFWYWQLHPGFFLTPLVLNPSLHLAVLCLFMAFSRIGGRPVCHLPLLEGVRDHFVGK